MEIKLSNLGYNFDGSTSGSSNVSQPDKAPVHSSHSARKSHHCQFCHGKAFCLTISVPAQQYYIAPRAQAHREGGSAVSMIHPALSPQSIRVICRDRIGPLNIEACPYTEILHSV